jgi:putative SOS response-associated peptidase YedK
MCGRYSLATPTGADLRSRFALGESVELRQRFNVCPGDDVPAVTTDRDGAPRGELLRWGLVPYWSKDTSSAYKMITARAETLAERPAYRDALRTHRCLVVADGFYEWQPREGRPKLPWWVTRADGAPFAFAGLWATWSAPDGTQLRTCTIVTTEANATLREIHSRMPVILRGRDEERAWLDHATPAAALPELLVALPDDLTGRRPVGTAVNDARFDGPECLDPPEPEPEPLALY